MHADRRQQSSEVSGFVRSWRADSVVGKVERRGEAVDITREDPSASLVDLVGEGPHEARATSGSDDEDVHTTSAWVRVGSIDINALSSG